MPLYLGLIGADRYGILAILWVLMGYFGLFDLGLGRAVTNRIALLQDDSRSSASTVFWTSLLTTLVIGSVASVILWFLGSYLFGTAVQTDESLRREAVQALPYLVVAFPFVLAVSIPQGALAGKEHFLALNLIRVVEGTLLQVVPFAVAKWIAPNVTSLVIGVVAVKLSLGLVAAVLSFRLLKVSWVPTWNRDELRALLRFGGWLTVSSIIGPLLVTLDRLVIASLAGAAAVAYYTVPYGLASRIMVFPTSLCSAAFPRLSAANQDQRQQIAFESLQLLSSAITPMTVVGIFAMQPFLTLWLGEPFSDNASTIGEIIAVGVWSTCFAVVPYTVLQSLGRTDIPAKIHMAELIPYLAVMTVLIWKFGATGAAIAWAVRCWVDAWLHFRFCNLSITPVLFRHMAVIGLSFVVVQFLTGSSDSQWTIRSCLLLTVLAFQKNEILQFMNAARQLVSRPTRVES